jgi:hypothetical protein
VCRTRERPVSGAYNGIANIRNWPIAGIRIKPDNSHVYAEVIKRMHSIEHVTTNATAFMSIGVVGFAPYKTLQTPISMGVSEHKRPKIPANAWVCIP